MCLAPDAPTIEQKMDPPPAEAPAPLASPYTDDDMNSGLSGLRVATRSGLKVRGKGNPAGKPTSTTSSPSVPSTPSTPSKGIQPIGGSGASGGGSGRTPTMEL